MKKSDVITALAALAQDNRLDVFRLLVEAGPEGMPAGAVATTLDLAPNTLTFHFDRLRTASLVTVRREGRSMIYAAQFETMNALLGYSPTIAAAAFPARPLSPASRRGSAPGFQPERNDHEWRALRCRTGGQGFVLKASACC